MQTANCNPRPCYCEATEPLSAQMEHNESHASRGEKRRGDAGADTRHQQDVGSSILPSNLRELQSNYPPILPAPPPLKTGTPPSAPIHLNPSLSYPYLLPPAPSFLHNFITSTMFLQSFSQAVRVPWYNKHMTAHKWIYIVAIQSLIFPLRVH